ncbi:Orn/Lys/Arg decarboxylase N-terminal domain-containing protein [Streptomyces niveiscabiei]|uniref:Orn/Lys/Arg family decarboxylase n=1 Tax=Streptomyces niveiscabiei TaxID=164115 RepID=UPI0029B16ABD|nr:Orn/Lys/Arg decarboxylase N-terminal domain-containing protein [Streptomyces niveiscabiei]MDX3386023.1 Orn/Lys/Arg decarboxylase N-terminal domain-containing protein [Streptomyces niveiscabiei]
MSHPLVLIAVTERSGDDSAHAEQIRRIADEITARGFTPRWVTTAKDALSVIRAEAGLTAVLLDWRLPGTGGGEPAAQEVLEGLRRRATGLPVFLVLEEDGLQDLPLWVAEVVIGYVWLDEDTPTFLAGRITRAARDYQEGLLPPFFRELVRFDDSHEYSWHTPAHAGGVAFLRSPVGRAFYDYYGEQLFRSDLTCSIEQLGSTWEHTGPIGDSERNAARIFGAERTYYVLQGTSNANRMVGHHCVVRDQLAVLDRNCHKSVHHAMIMAGARPVYVTGSRNGYGLMGPVPPAQLTGEAVAAALDGSLLTPGALSPDPVYAALTSSTYDGLLYDAQRVAELLGASVPRLHFDEAWSAYTLFHPLYDRRSAMSVRERDGEAALPSLFATQSTHKLLAALSQSSMVHVRSSPRAPVDHERFNQTFMMHGTTSPLYPMLASLDVAAGMMDGAAGPFLIHETVVEAIRFRQAIPRLARAIRDSGDRPDWFFGVWQPPTVTDPATGAELPFEDAPVDLLAATPAAWHLAPDQDWHGYPGLEPGYCLLDPVKVTVTCPGVRPDGTAEAWGIPGKIINAYLYDRRVIVDKYDPYSFILFFSMGITKGKWGTLIDVLTDFKALYDANAPLADVLPDVVAAHPDRYGSLTLPQFCAEMHEDTVTLTSLLRAVSEDLPGPVMPPVDAYEHLVQGRTERVPLRDLPGRVPAVMVATTPPGSPLLVPGERVGPATSPLMRYLTALEDFDRRFPGFASETHGVSYGPDGGYWFDCVAPDTAESGGA